MKKILIMFLVVLSLFSLTACGGKSAQERLAELELEEKAEEREREREEEIHNIIVEAERKQREDKRYREERYRETHYPYGE